MRTKILLVAGAVMMGGLQIASAADLPRRSQVAPAPIVVPAYNWSGFYIGGHIGGAWSQSDWTFFNGIVSEPFAQDASGWIGGGQAGFLWQWGNAVFGIEGTYSATDLDATTTATLAPDRSRRSKIDDLWTVTGRLGYAWDRSLSYVKGGYANGRVSYDTFVTSSGLPTTTSKAREGGWTLGAGWEYAFWQNVSLALEYDYVRLNIGDRNQTVFPGFVSPETVTSARADIHAITGRLNFKFGP